MNKSIKTKGFSQNLEEYHILKYFGDYVGTFLDIGANDGITFSNTRALALRSWKGVMVEPSPQAFDRLKNLYEGRSDLYVYQIALGEFVGVARFHESGPLCTSADVGLVSTLHTSELGRFIDTVGYNSVLVHVSTWETLLSKLKIKEFDFVSIDAEGSDLSILRQIDLSSTKLICLEWNGNKTLKSKFEKCLNGFKLIYVSGENLLYGR